MQLIMPHLHYTVLPPVNPFLSLSPFLRHSVSLCLPFSVSHFRFRVARPCIGLWGYVLRRPSTAAEYSSLRFHFNIVLDQLLYIITTGNTFGFSKEFNALNAACLSHSQPNYNIDILDIILDFTHQEPTETSKQPIRTRYLGHVTGYQPIRDQYFLIRSVPVTHSSHTDKVHSSSHIIVSLLFTHTYIQYTHSPLSLFLRHKGSKYI
eukprot:sb/3470377/